MRSGWTVVSVFAATVLVGCEPGSPAPEAVASASPSVLAEASDGDSEHSPAPPPTPALSDPPPQPSTLPPPQDKGPCDDGGASSAPAPGLPTGDALAEATLHRASRKGCYFWVLRLKNLEVVWQADEIVYPDDVDNPVEIPVLPTTLKARTSGQAIGRLQTPAPVVVWLTYDDFIPRWRVEYVMHADTLQPLRATRDSALANNHLRLLYRDDEDTRDERIAAQVERLKELQSTRASALGRKRPTPRIDYLRSRTDP